MNLKTDAWNLNPNDYYNACTPEERIKHILRYGLLSPSTHNTQPWRFKINATSCELYSDPEVKLYMADPDGRNLYISMGCLIETIIVAAKYFNVYDNVIYNTHSNNPVARINFKNLLRNQKCNNALEPLMNAIVQRSTYRGVFTGVFLSKHQKEMISNASTINNVQVSLYNDSGSKAQITKLTSEAVEFIANDKKFRHELSEWMISNYSNRKDGIPGYSYGFSNVASIIAPWLMRLLNPSRIMAKKTYSTFSSAASLIIISTIEDKKIDWVNAGRVSQLVMLLLTSEKIRFSISVAAIQSKEHFAKLRSLLNTNAYPQFILAAGSAEYNRKLTPRYDLKNKLYYL